ncbi:putative bifunctional diguanylate cyclase/phosphodiesterase [Candidatus Nitrospira bockiana]
MGEPVRILHLEDNPRDSELVAAQLTAEGLDCEITRVETREDFAVAVEQRRFDLILSDFSLPSYDGRSALALVQQRAPDVPFVFFSGTIGEEAAIEALTSGATDYVLKHRPGRCLPVIVRALREARERADRQRAEAAWHAAEDRFRGIYESSKDAITYAGLDGRLQDVNRATAALLGYSRDELLTKTHDQLTPAEYRSADEAIRRRVVETGEPAEYEKEYLHKDGRRIPIVVTLFLVKAPDGRPAGLASILKDVTEQKRREATILELAYHDPLTGLANRRLFSDHVGLAVSQARRKRAPFAVLLLDLDGFKTVNDTLGHAKGDLLLQQVAARLKASVRSGDTVARLGGDEFSILLLDLTHRHDATMIAKKILDAFRLPFSVDGQVCPVTASLGISVYPDDGMEGEALLKNADRAMYQAKEEGGNASVLCTDALKAKAAERLSLERRLRHALEREEFQVYYQPVIDVQTEEVIGTEALLRWGPPGCRLMAPNDFIQVAEETGLMAPITLWVLKTACLQTKAWHRLGFAQLRLAVNLSDRPFWQPDFISDLQGVMQDSGVEPEFLDLEITERMTMPSADMSLSQLEALSSIGIQLAMDDFGTGYSSLTSLRHVPVKVLKIDQSFVRGLGRSAEDAAIVKALIMLAHNLRLKVIAEGVETREQLSFLRAHGCDGVQGYLFSPPLAAEALTEWLSADARRAPCSALPLASWQ